MRTRASQYEHAAVWFGQKASDCGDVARRLSRSLPFTTIAGGTVRDTLDDAIGVTIQNLVQIATGLQVLATESVRRAQVCREYEHLLRRHDVAFDAWRAMPPGLRAGLAPSVPVPPATWVRG